MLSRSQVSRFQIFDPLCERQHNTFLHGIVCPFIKRNWIYKCSDCCEEAFEVYIANLGICQEIFKSLIFQIVE